MMKQTRCDTRSSPQKRQMQRGEGDKMGGIPLGRHGTHSSKIKIRSSKPRASVFSRECVRQCWCQATYPAVYGEVYQIGGWALCLANLVALLTFFLAPYLPDISKGSRSCFLDVASPLDVVF